MFVDINEKILEKYNSDLKIKPFLDVYPFEGSRIGLGLWFPQNKKEGSIVSMHRYGNKISYEIVTVTGSTRTENESYDSLYNSVYGKSQENYPKKSIE